MIVSQNYRSYRFYSSQQLDSPQLEALIRRLQAPPGKSQGVLGGRIQPETMELDRIGRVVIKAYFRGGVLRHINKRTYLGLGKARSKAEFEMLQHVRVLGINAPEPVAYAVKGSLLYHAWLITRQIPEARPLSELCLTQPSEAEKILPSVAEQVGILVSAGIYHVDLHPGNVLADARGNAYLIDFDRAKTGIQNQQKLIQQYVHRWKRAAHKYRLPEFVSDCLGWLAGQPGS